MATSELDRPRVFASEPPRSKAGPKSQFWPLKYLSALSSLRLTVVLFAAAIFLIFTGSLAQKDHDVWEVVNDLYFRTWIAHVDFQVFERFAQIFFKDVRWNLPTGYYLPFPGGNFIGTLLLANLIAAHAVRFKIAAAGRRLSFGFVAIAAGILVTYFAIKSGMNDAIESELSPEFCDTLWQLVRGSLAALALIGGYLALTLRGRIRAIEWRLLLGIELVIAALAIWLLVNPEARLDNAGLRILWQLLKGSAAGLALLLGCVLVFRKRAGIVLLHGGIALMMLSELFTGITARESRMVLPIGGSANSSEDIRSTELAVVDHSDAVNDRITVVPSSLLKANIGQATSIDDAQLPFKIQVRRWLPNSELREAKRGEANLATTGAGEQLVADDAPAATGVGERAKFADRPATYVELFSKETGKSIGTLLASDRLNPQPVNVDGKTYDVALRYKQVYYPFTLTLKDFKFRRYVGTNTPKDYRSTVVLDDPRHGVNREVPIWMNNPLRYDQTTFYQADFDHEQEKYTVLTAVNNPSWMTPYVACMLVATGMLTHFGIMLFRFLKRRADEERLAGPADSQYVFGNGHPTDGGSVKRRRENVASSSAWTTSAVWFPAIVVLIFAGYVLGKTRMPESKPSEMQIYHFAKLPLAYQGRIKPYETLARNTLQILSGRQELEIVDQNGNTTFRPAIVWLLDVISGSQRAEDHRVFRILNTDLLDTLALEHRPGHWRYSLKELETKPGELRRQIDMAGKIPEEKRTLFQAKVLELATNQNLYAAITYAFRTPPISSERDQVMESIQRTQQLILALRDSQAPCAVPPNDASVNWTPLLEARFENLRNQLLGKPLNDAATTLSELLAAYSSGDVGEFNNKLADYRHLVGNYEQSIAAKNHELRTSGVAKSEILNQKKINFEVFYNEFSPFYYAAALYFVAFLLGVFSWIGWSKPLRRASIWLLALTLILHTFALGARIYISGRPPITNLYSTAIFIGWGGVIIAMVFELIYGLGLGNIAAAIIGFLTLIVAHFLSLDGDTFIVLQAVLDTQFWLATHVVTINLGYAATYTAGLWGLIYVLFVHVFPVLSQDTRHKLTRVTYGTLCFAIYFSFVGTVLGGLWGDDSWGRFWGWDPKENGALMIVIWNALVLHARWGGLVKARGLATLTVLGNIVTTWSYFGVNELGVGLHAYGAFDSNSPMQFFKSPTAMWLFFFVSLQLAIACLGMMPQHWFDSMRLSREHV